MERTNSSAPDTYSIESAGLDIWIHYSRVKKCPQTVFPDFWTMQPATSSEEDLETEALRTADAWEDKAIDHSCSLY